MAEVTVERRSEFRFPVVVPVEYFGPDESGVSSYSSDLTKKGTFISSDDPMSVGESFRLNLTIPINQEASKIHRTEGRVVWNRALPFKSKKNGMGVRFVEPLTEDLLLRALAYNVKNLIKDSEAKRLLEQKVDKLEVELDSEKRLAVLGRFVEKIIFDLSNPILAISGKLDLIKSKMDRHRRSFEEREEITKEEFKEMLAELDNDCREVDQILRGYKVIAELAQIVEEDRDTLEKRLKKKYSL